MAKKAQNLTKKQKEFIEIFEKKMCLITHACQSSGVALRTYYNWMQKDKFREEIDNCRTRIKDFGEAALYTLIKEKVPSAVIFFNKCKNKDRGYIEKSEQVVEHKSDQLKVIVEVKKPEE